jgi:hypothetical protein
MIRNDTTDLRGSLPLRNFDRTIDDLGNDGSSGAALQYPFQIGTRGVDPAIVNVRWGTVNDVAPTDVASDITLTANATTSLYIRLTLDVDTVGTITATELLTSTSGKPADDDTHASILVGEVVVDANGIITQKNQAITHSLRFRCCGREAADPGAVPPIAFARGEYYFWGI